MAGIKSLAVRGIRSFGPEEADEQRILFDKPLTLILGQNGCGKTTIIECVRYAITGNMPPGSRNECFVHDPKVNRSTEVLAQVKLKIINAKDEQLEVSRSMKVTALQKKKTKFQTLDSFLSIIDVNGKTKDISSRCADLDFVMYEQLGVSKAILNSVIFCHQEDSSWPLDEGKKVKERFDEIFDADKYSDCFDRLRKIRKDYTIILKLLEQEVSILTEKKEDLDKKKLEVVNGESEISEAELKLAELTTELKAITDKIKAISQLERNILTFETEKEKIKTKLEHCQSQEEELKTEIKNIFEGTTAELEEAINNYVTTAIQKKKELEASYKKNTTFNKEEEKIANEKTSNEIKLNKLLLLESQNQEKIDKRKTMIVEVAKVAEIEDVNEITTDEEADKGIKLITDKITNLKNDLNEQKSAADAEEQRMQEAIDACRVAHSRHQEKISSKKTEINKNKKEIVKLDKSINDANESKVKLEAMEKKSEDAEEELKKAQSEMSPEECQQEINDDEKAVETHENELVELDEKIVKLQKHNDKIKERELIENSLKEKEKKFAVLKNKHKTALTELLGSMPESGFAISVNKLECDIRNEVDSMKQKMKEKQLEQKSLETERKHVRESLNEKRSELTKAEDKMYQACGTQTYESTLAKLTSTVESLQDEQNVLQSSMFIFAKYKTQLKDNSCCPLCSRGFDNDSEVTDLISQLTTQVMNVPSKLEKVTEELQRNSAKKDELLSMKSVNEKITSLKEKEIPNLETRLKDIEAKISILSNSVDELSMTVIEPEQKLQTAKQIQGDMPMLDRYTKEIKTDTEKYEKLKEQCAELESDMSLDDANAKRTDLRTKISALRTRVKNNQKKLNAYNKKIQSMADKKNKLKEQLLALQKKVQEIVTLQEKRKQLETDEEKLNDELKELEDGTTPLKEELEEKEKAKAEVVKKNRAALEVKNSFITKVVSAFDKVKTIEAEIKQHIERNIEKEMDKIKEANDKLMEKQKQIMIDRDALTKRIDSLKDELAKQDIYKNDLDKNSKLRKAQEEIEKCKVAQQKNDENMSGLNREMLSEKEPLITQQTKIFREKAQTEGKLGQLNITLKQNKLELKKAEAKNIEKQYKEKFFELHVTRAIDKDIRDYAVALEKSLMEFHREKMENINLIIREMWRKIYRGNDIDYIEIKTEGSMTSDSDRRKYDYRVVQCKNGMEIDMRGRCSAGQKVLACLIIRLALAETFSARFGILALDEPTTNLDQENITSLCSALGEIVQERMTQRNFMFIIITHDREFIESLGNIDKVTHYYEVSRNDEGRSRIKRIRFS
ncbi:DNA repair protein RAD50 [Plodia interpunctella]|uniref:DNA repair protein RAD50 n=1 Tax=Plodia interpunctella TaxID=58824 RepID=UPI002367B7CD|nr:DNA repair protein RAD50 [Plodia interpunctella]